VSVADRAIRSSTAAVVVGVSAVAAYLSYKHAYELVSTHGESGASAAVMPATVDGLIFASSMVMLDAARHGRSAPALARWTLALGIGASLAANVMHGITSGPIGAIVAGWPALALILVYELLMKLIRDSAEIGHVESTSPMVDAEALPDELPPDDEWIPDTPEHLIDWNEGKDTPPPVLDSEERAVLDARQRFSSTLAAGNTPSVRAIKRELNVGHPRATRIRAALAKST